MESKIFIEIFVIDRPGPYAARRWCHVPRIGDLINLGGEEEGLHKIENIVWNGSDKPVVSLNVRRFYDEG